MAASRIAITSRANKGFARMLRELAKLASTLTGQLPARLHAWRRASAAELERAAERLEALERQAAELQGVIGRLEAVEQRAVEAQHVVAGLDALERRAADLTTGLRGERDRLDWALAALEGVTAQIDAYHAYRSTDEYRTAYTSVDPLVSICVATVDRAGLLLERCIPSLLAQTYRNLQIVVVGDNCMDDTMQRLASHGDSRIQFVNLPGRVP